MGYFIILLKFFIWRSYEAHTTREGNYVQRVLIESESDISSKI